MAACDVPLSGDAAGAGSAGGTLGNTWVRNKRLNRWRLRFNVDGAGHWNGNQGQQPDEMGEDRRDGGPQRSLAKRTWRRFPGFCCQVEHGSLVRYTAIPAPALQAEKWRGFRAKPAIALLVAAHSAQPCAHASNPSRSSQLNHVSKATTRSPIRSDRASCRTIRRVCVRASLVATVSTWARRMVQRPALHRCRKRGRLGFATQICSPRPIP